MKKLVYNFIIMLGLLVMHMNASATHNRAGEITYRWIEGYTYEITVTTFTYVLSQANRPSLEVQWGDGTSQIVSRVEQIILPNLYFRNKYIAQHSYPGPGSYKILMQDPNRNLGIRNIPNSVNTIFSIESTLIVNPILGKVSTPILLNPPIDKGAVGHIFIHNPAAFDADGDSLSYRLTPCTEENGIPIPGYTLPLSSHDPVHIDSLGNLTWNAPVDTGAYNIAFLIEKWKNGIKLASVERDMQINIYRTTNQAPIIDSIGNFCVLEGTSIDLDIHITDPNKDSIIAFATGGPFITGPDLAHFTLVSSKSKQGDATYHFSWQTDCFHVRNQPYQILIKAKDTLTDISLSTFRLFNINVIGKKPQNLKAKPASTSILLTWDTVVCENVRGYEIYRRISPSGFVPDSCTTGIPRSYEFVLAGTTKSRLDTLFIDDNKGLSKGNNYCYRIVAIYPNGARSVASDEVCTILVPGLPALMQVSVDKIGVADGIMRVSWLKPLRLDTLGANGPYKYFIYRSPDLYGNSLLLHDSIFTSNLNDTFYLDKNINTVTGPYSYKVALYNNAPGDHLLLGLQQEVASSLNLSLVGKDKEIFIDLIKNVPWINSRYIIYRYNNSTSVYDSIGYSDTTTYVDKHLTNGVNYCYQAKSIGYRKNGGIKYTNYNFSHPACTIPVDTIPPCAPILTVTSLCDSNRNVLVWNNPNHSCTNDVMGYNIYYSPLLATDLVLIDSIRNNPDDTIYIHYKTLVGCYEVTAIDSARNESRRSPKVCVDICSLYSLPNVFTPNGDGTNDIFYAKNPNGFVKKVDMKIYNRWGQLVYHTTDALINWDGRLLNTRTMVSAGVYYYICDVYEPRLTGLEARNIVGFIYVFTNKQTVPNE